jgi:prepilin-type N-terminal cleavage/methylation domain-containing protein/prepilin-type processing-associated H-X9-DG protein
VPSSNSFRFQRRPRAGSPSRAFTLVELLVVIAIIAVLAGLALPGLNHARQSSNLALCEQNLSRIGVASGLYSADHNDEIVPRFANYDAPDVVNGPGGYWYQNLRPYFGLDKNITAYKTPPFVCPADRSYNLAQFLTSCSYGYNYMVVGDAKLTLDATETPIARRRTQFPHPSQVLFAADSVKPTQTELGPDLPPDPTRHPGGMVNVLWLDGHASRLSAATDLGPGSAYYVFSETQQ